MRRMSLRVGFALACVVVARLSGQTFDDPASAFASPQGDGVYAFNSSGYVIAGPSTSCNPVASDPNDVWLCYSPATSGTARFTVCPSSLVITGGSVTPVDATMALFDASGPGGSPGTELACQNGGGPCGLAQPEIGFAVTAGSLYYVQLQSWGVVATISGNLAVGLTPAPGPGDACSTAYARLGPGIATLLATTALAGGSSTCAGAQDVSDQWIAYTATSTGVAYASPARRRRTRRAARAPASRRTSPRMRRAPRGRRRKSRATTGRSRLAVSAAAPKSDSP
jgi:hypothetical protein